VETGSTSGLVQYSQLRSLSMDALSIYSKLVLAVAIIDVVVIFFKKKKVPLIAEGIQIYSKRIQSRI
jgi:hypothetical protein